ncbi:hypothetical protein HJC23_009446 [Cyclotella cryptica]|uniref:Uncharacterized protein n=1 Tax=Cyclotella cryptica TaxID=29204 RepID=A0ABD3Q0T3_9STRA
MCISMQSSALKLKSPPVEPRSFTLKRRPSDHILTVPVPTFRVIKKPKQMDTTDISSFDLETLKRTDLFMYYSIPAVRSAAMHSEERYPSMLPDSSETKTDSDTRKARKITRQCRVSTECHPDLLFEEMFNDEDLVATLPSENSELDDYLLSLFPTAQESGTTDGR